MQTQPPATLALRIAALFNKARLDNRWGCSVGHAFRNFNPLSRPRLPPPQRCQRLDVRHLSLYLFDNTYENDESSSRCLLAVDREYRNHR